MLRLVVEATQWAAVRTWVWSSKEPPQNNPPLLLNATSIRFKWERFLVVMWGDWGSPWKETRAEKPQLLSQFCLESHDLLIILFGFGVLELRTDWLNWFSTFCLFWQWNPPACCDGEEEADYETAVSAHRLPQRSFVFRNKWRSSEQVQCALFYGYDETEWVYVRSTTKKMVRSSRENMV